MYQATEIETSGAAVHRTGRDAIYAVCRDILEHGDESAPRGMATKELLGYSFIITDPWDTLADGINRARFSRAIAAAEALQDVAYMATPHLMSRISAGFPAPSSKWDDGVQTYGKRLGQNDQLGAVVRKLQSDPDSRQAVALIWRPTDMEGTPDDPSQAHNVCTVALQFMVRRDQLVQFAIMRSNDAWHGLPYDLHQFAQIQCSIANALDLDVGPYYHHASSMHLYDKHWEAAAALEPADSFGPEPSYRHMGFGRRGMPWSEIQLRAKAILAGSRFLDGEATDTEQWHIDTLARFEPDGT